MTQEEVRQIPSSSLAYLGDAAVEILVRRYLVTHPAAGEHPSQRSLTFVTAPAQSAALEAILPHLTEDEADVFHRGRNSVHANVPKSATPSEYRRATGFECLFGYLFLTGQAARAEELFRIGYDISDDL